MLGERLRRGSDAINVKRAESMKIGPKITKRTPSFTTRRRAQSFRKNQQTDQLDLPPVEIQGMLERKHELQSGGKRAPVRAWKSFHTVLCGQLLCFFKDEEDFFQKKAATAPVNILNARCEKADNYTKRKNVFRLHLPDGSEFLFLAANKIELLDWVNKLSFHASLPPNLQLMSYDESIKITVSTHNTFHFFHSFKRNQISMKKTKNIRIILQQTLGSPKASSDRTEASPISSHNSSPESQRRSSRHDSIGSSMSGGSFNTPQINFLQKQKELRDQQQQQLKINLQTSSATPASLSQSPQSPSGGGHTADKPPIPPRGLPPPVPQRQSSNDTSTVTLRTRLGMISILFNFNSVANVKRIDSIFHNLIHYRFK